MKFDDLEVLKGDCHGMFECMTPVQNIARATAKTADPKNAFLVYLLYQLTIQEMEDGNNV